MYQHAYFMCLTAILHIRPDNPVLFAIGLSQGGLGTNEE